MLPPQEEQEEDLKQKNAKNTKNMIFNISHLVFYVSKFMTLYPGDIITTGTPPGVGMAKKPKIFLKEGDEMVLSIDNLGNQKQKVVKI